MPLPAHQLEAFHAVAEAKSFSKAASRLHITQPALSQRIQQLESELKRRLFVRTTRGAELTETGLRLLRYCQVQRTLESELLEDLAVENADRALAGTVRIGAFSSVARSCVIPALGPVFRENPRLGIDVMVREIAELETAFTQGAFDFAVLDRAIERPDVEHVVLGQESLVLVESAHSRTRDDVYLDHDQDDPTTLQFLKRNGIQTRYVRRSFFDDIYGILEAAAEGYGRAVVPRHILDGFEQLRVVEGTKPGRSAVVLHWFRQTSYARAIDVVRDALVSGVRTRLAMATAETRRSAAEPRAAERRASPRASRRARSAP